MATVGAAGEAVEHRFLAGRIYFVYYAAALRRIARRVSAILSGPVEVARWVTNHTRPSGYAARPAREGIQQCILACRTKLIYPAAIYSGPIEIACGITDHPCLRVATDGARRKTVQNGLFTGCVQFVHYAAARAAIERSPIEVPRRVATALLIGLNTDTAQLTRDVSEADVTAFARLYRVADVALNNAILRNHIQTKDLVFFRFAIDNLQIEDGLAFCHFPDGCNQNLLGILGDFFLALQEVDFVVLAAHNAGGVNLSVRNERPGTNAAAVIQEVLAGIGFGGGHRDMAGGLVRDAAKFDRDLVRARFVAAARTGT